MREFWLTEKVTAIDLKFFLQIVLKINLNLADTLDKLDWLDKLDKLETIDTIDTIDTNFMLGMQAKNFVAQ